MSQLTIYKNTTPNTLKFEGIPVGTKIRSYHFQPMADRPDSYIEGVILEVTEMHGAKVYKLQTTLDIVAGESNEITDQNAIHYVPMETWLMEYDERIQIITPPARDDVEIAAEARRKVKQAKAVAKAREAVKQEQRMERESSRTLQNAARVIQLTPHIRQYLERTDPKALEQLEVAIADHAMVHDMA